MVDFVKLDEEKKNGKSGGSSDEKSFWSWKNFFLIFLLFFLLSSIFSSVSDSMTPKIAVVPIKGVILTDEDNSLFGGSSVSSRDIAQTLLELKDDNSVKAVLLDINSPGGSPVASEEISRAIEEVKKEKPVYALINDVGASGAFWIAVSANKTYVSSMSQVGSIGVTSAGLGFEDFIKEYNITYRKQTAGEFKDMGSPYREPTKEEEEILQGILDEIHANFIEHVAVSRNMSYENVEKYATGEVFLGSKAVKVGFADEIGYYPDVISELENITSATTIVNYGPEPTFADLLGFGVLNDGLLPTAESQVLLK